MCIQVLMSSLQSRLEPPRGTGRLTVQDAIDHIGFGRFQVRIGVIIGLVYVCDAMEVMLLSFLGPAIRCESWGVSPQQESLLTTGVFVGMMLGAWVWGSVADRWGRKVAIYATSLWIGAAGLASAASVNYGMLLCTRAAVGFALGGVPVSFSYFLEFVPAARRGVLGVACQGLWTVGTFVEVVLGWALLRRAGWQWLLFASSIPVLFLVPFFRHLPESPRFLLVGPQLRPPSPARARTHARTPLADHTPNPRAAGAAAQITGQRARLSAALRQVAAANGRSLPGDDGLLLVPDAAGASPDGLAAPEAGRASDGVRSRKPPSSLQVLRNLASPALRWNTGRLYTLWFTNAFAYYGLVLLTTELSVDTEGGSEVRGRDGVRWQCGCSCTRSSRPLACSWTAGGRATAPWTTKIL